MQLTEAEGLAMRPGPRPAINLDVLGQLRELSTFGHSLRWAGFVPAFSFVD